MDSVAFIVDSTADFPIGWKPPLDLYKLPLRLIVNGKEYRDGIDIDSDRLCELMSQGHSVSTSLPSMEDITRLFKEIKDNYEQIFVLTVSQKLSGTFNAVRMVIENLGLKNFLLLDSKAVSGKIFYILSRLMKDAMEGKRISQQSVAEYGKHCEMFFLLGSLDYLKKGGRIGKLSLLLGKLLHVKPVLKIDREGEVTKAAVGMNQHDAIAKLVALVKSSAEKFSNYLLYGGYGSVRVKGTLEQVLSNFPKCDGLARVGATILAHTGPEVIGVLVGEGF
ncbi:MAG: DegV family protein [Thermotoga caldifontis]|uniref:DegV family protein n=1 Tax=Thermotoga caldifontis TaxID=1508419 RepID=UPI003C7D20F6